MAVVYFNSFTKQEQAIIKLLQKENRAMTIQEIQNNTLKDSSFKFIKKKVQLLIDENVLKLRKIPDRKSIGLFFINPGVTIK